MQPDCFRGAAPNASQISPVERRCDGISHRHVSVGSVSPLKMVFARSSIKSPIRSSRNVVGAFDGSADKMFSVDGGSVLYSLTAAQSPLLRLSSAAFLVLTLVSVAAFLYFIQSVRSLFATASAEILPAAAAIGRIFVRR